MTNIHLPEVGTPGSLNRRNVGKYWSEKEEHDLINLIYSVLPLNYICNTLERNPGGIAARLYKLIDEERLYVSNIKYLYPALGIELGDQAITNMEKLEQTLTEQNRKSNMSDKKGKLWTMVSLLQEDIHTVKVLFNKYENGVPKVYTYKTRDKSIVEGDYVVVNPRAEKGFFNIGYVDSIDKEPDINPDSGFRYHWIVSKIDTANYDKLVKLDEEAYKLLKEAEKAVAKRNLMTMYMEELQLPSAAEFMQLAATRVETEETDKNE